MEKENYDRRFQKRKRKVYSAYKNKSRHPVIYLGGKYLRFYSFNIGDQIEVFMEPNQILIKRIPCEPPPEIKKPNAK